MATDPIPVRNLAPSLSGNGGRTPVGKRAAENLMRLPLSAVRCPLRPLIRPT